MNPLQGPAAAAVVVPAAGSHSEQVQREARGRRVDEDDFEWENAAEMNSVTLLNSIVNIFDIVFGKMCGKD